jgi:hypothetical protein
MAFHHPISGNANPKSELIHQATLVIIEKVLLSSA